MTPLAKQVAVGTGLSAYHRPGLGPRRCRVVLVGRRSEKLDETAASIPGPGGRPLVVAGDVA